MDKTGNENSPKYLANSCKRWLEVVALLHIFGGLSLSFNWPSIIWSEYQQKLFESFNISSTIGTEVKFIVTMLTQLFGPTIASWGVLMFFFIRKISIDALSSNETKKNINVLLLSTAIWFVFDTVISLKFGVVLHAAINVLAALSIFLPLLYLRFKKGE